MRVLIVDDELSEQILMYEPTMSILAVFGNEVPEAMRRAAARGVFACLPKPLDPQEVARVIARARGQETRACAVGNRRGAGT